ncbi:MAG TPA: phage tail protein [Alphaproteobacteria bacterium]|nr:phage tail protein [Alphaproteobacteria bacterium]
MGFLFPSKVNASNPPTVTGIRVQTSANGLPIPVVHGMTRFAGNIVWYGNFQQIAHSSNAGGGGKGGGGLTGGKGGGSVTYTYSVWLVLALCEGPITGIGDVWSSKSRYTPAELNLSLFTGTATQAAWGPLASTDPGQALAYRGIAYVAAAPFDLGTSQQLPNLNVAVQGAITNAIPGAPDADPAACIQDILANANYGLGFPAGNLGDLSLYSSYCRATGLVISQAYTEQRAGSRWIQELLDATNSAAVWSSGLLTIVPYGDQPASANGASYTPPSQPLYSLGDDDFLNFSGRRSQNGPTPESGRNADPVQMLRKRPADQLNNVKLEYLDAGNDYNPAIAEAKDEAAIETYGLRTSDTRQAHFFTIAAAARLSAQLQLQRQQVRNQYTFYLGPKYMLLDPMDIVAISDPGLGLADQWVRILDIQEEADPASAAGGLALAGYRLKVTAEDYLAGTGSAPLYGQQPNSGYAANYNSDPGSVNAPIIFEPPEEITDTGLEVWAAVSGGANWGGCDVWASTDGNTYRHLGRVQGAARMGRLAAALPAGSDPDTADTLAVDLTESGGTLLSGTQADADASHTLCYVDGELIAYESAALVSGFTYDLAYLRRGRYGTAIAGHATGAAFARLDDAILKIPYSKDQIGQTLYLKFVSFNIFGGGAQSLAAVAAYSHVIQGPPPPANVTGFTAQQQGGVVAFNWNLAGITDAYDIRYGPQGAASWDEMLPLTEAAKGTEMTNASVPPGTWTFAIRARDVYSDLLSPQPATVDRVITNPNPVVAQAPQAPGWPGTVSGFYRHWSGVLVPLGTKPVAAYAPLAAPAAPSLGSTAGGALAAATYFVRVAYTTAGGETLASAEASLAVPAGSLLTVASPPAVAGAAAWNVYVGMSAGQESRQNAAPIALGIGWSEPASGLVAGAAPPSQNTTGFEPFDLFVPDPVANPYYEAPLIDTGFTDTLRVWAGLSAALGPGVIGQPAVSLEIDAYPDGADPGSFQPWVIGTLALRYLRARVYETTSGADVGVACITAFTPTADRSPKLENSAQNATVAPGGTVIAFPSPYHADPNVTLTVIGGSALTATAVDVTPAQFTAHVWDHNGNDVGGIVSWLATGS